MISDQKMGKKIKVIGQHWRAQHIVDKDNAVYFPNRVRGAIRGDDQEEVVFSLLSDRD